jgi:hypothetical protein
MRREGVLAARDTTGKGGHYPMYSALLNRDAFKLALAETLREKARELHE